MLQVTAMEEKLRSIENATSFLGKDLKSANETIVSSQTPPLKALLKAQLSARD